MKKTRVEWKFVFALLGTVLGTASLSWQVYEHRSERPVLRVEFDDQTLLGKIGEDPTKVRMRFAVSNVCSRPVSVYEMSVSPHLLTSTRDFMNQDWERRQQLGDIPFKLDAGEVQLFSAEWSLLNPTSLVEEQEYLLCWRVEMKTTAGQYLSDFQDHCQSAVYDVAVPVGHGE